MSPLHNLKHLKTKAELKIVKRVCLPIEGVLWTRVHHQEHEVCCAGGTREYQG